MKRLTHRHIYLTPEAVKKSLAEGVNLRPFYLRLVAHREARENICEEWKEKRGEEGEATAEILEHEKLEEEEKE